MTEIVQPSGTPRGQLSRQVVEHMPALRRYGRLLMHTPDRADDLVHDTVERALSRSHLYRPDTNLRAWLFTIMRNVAVTQTRKERLRRAYCADRMQTEPRWQPASQAQTVELKQSLRLLGGFSPGERQALLLLGLHELSYDEAVGLCRETAGTLKSRLSRGRARLRTLMDPAGA